MDHPRRFRVSATNATKRRRFAREFLARVVALALFAGGQGAWAALPNATVVEYYRSDVDHYFMTASPQEQVLLDNGTLAGWTRTGVTFLAWSDAAHASATAHPVCRFYGRPEAGLDSHFYSAFSDECDQVQAKFPLAWQLESPAVFYIEVPDRNTGACPAGTDPVYRVYDNRADVNHRYLVSLALRATMLAKGWIPEGYGPDAVVMCAPRFATSADDVAYADATFYAVEPGSSLASATEAAAVTHHALALSTMTIHYTATAGHLTARDPQSGQPQASFFYVAYTADGQDPATRPVTFFYNGGPGSATIWLHLGSFGPKRLVTGDPATTAPTPFPLVDNREALLDTTDLVFVDAVGTGLSEAIAPNTNQTFWGVDQDAAVFRNFIQRYLDANGRAASPKFLFGESYGTTRTAVLAYLMVTAGMDLDGIVLQSSVLNYNSNCGVVNSAISCAGYIPSYASIGAYYGLANPPPADLAAFRDQVQTFTLTTYTPEVNNVIASRRAPSASIIATLEGDTGIPQSLWQTNFNLDPGTFQYRLIASTVIGRYDARVSAPFGSPLASEGDPSSTLISPSFMGAIQPYLAGALGYSYPTAYVGLSNAINTWDFSHEHQLLPDTIPDLFAAIAHNPSMLVLSLNGYHDLATPYFQTMLDLARLADPGGVQIRSYAGGHMTYLDDVSRPIEKADIQAAYRGALAKRFAATGGAP